MTVSALRGTENNSWVRLYTAAYNLFAFSHFSILAMFDVFVIIAKVTQPSTVDTCKLLLFLHWHVNGSHSCLGKRNRELYGFQRQYLQIVGMVAKPFSYLTYS